MLAPGGPAGRWRQVNVSAITVLICTYNRAWLLRETLAAMQAMVPPSACAVEIIVVDNNSTDDTALVIAESACGGRFPVVSLQERQQGKSFALNLGLSHARGDVLALTDDDVVPSSEWLQRIVEDFRARDVTFVSGKVLPRWSRRPPPELLTLERRTSGGRSRFWTTAACRSITWPRIPRRCYRLAPTSPSRAPRS